MDRPHDPGRGNPPAPRAGEPDRQTGPCRGASAVGPAASSGRVRGRVLAHLRPGRADAEMAGRGHGRVGADGVLGGAGLVLTFLPILIVFFGALALVEDTGYLARSAYVMDRFMHALGLHGKSFLPLVLGFGCNVPAVMGARVIESRSGRLLTILLAPLVPCSARLTVLAFLAPAFFGAAALPVALTLVALNLLVLAAVGVA